jgi:uncharacterized integral membrane protein
MIEFYEEVFVKLFFGRSDFMPWKLVLFALAVIFVTIFIGFNLENSCDVSFGVYTFKDVPIFMSILFAFAIGVFIMFPFTLGHKKEKKSQQKKQPVQPQNVAPTKAPSYSDGNKPESKLFSTENSSSSQNSNSSEVK